MAWGTKAYNRIPGTYVFDGKQSAAAYRLNKLLFSFNRAENRRAFSENPEAYAAKFDLPNEQKSALLSGDFLKLLRMGGNIYYMAKLAVPSGLSVQDVGAAFHGITTDEFKGHLLDQSKPFPEKIAALEGYWNG